LTGIVGGVFLVVAFSLWLLRPGHNRLVLGFLVIAMFCAILHAYAFENTPDAASSPVSRRT
ncbi:MAG: hypothetical protein ACRDFS_13635, partial [Chloroflexota bacterium]